MLNITTKAKHRDIFPEVVSLLDNSKKFFERIGGADMEKKVAEMQAQLEEPFYLLVAGEYNSGKSSLLTRCAANTSCSKAQRRQPIELPS
ncbi:MAG: hypothetical protein AAB318_00820 [Planctomycetota bacterium]